MRWVMLKLLFFWPILHLWGAEDELCHYRFHMPPLAHVTSQTPALLMAEKTYSSIKGRPKIQWLFSCVENVNRTSQISEILKQAKEKEEVVERYEKISAFARC